MKKAKLSKLLKVLTPDPVDFSVLDQKIKELKEQLLEKVQVKTLDDVNSELEKFRKRINLDGLLEAVREIKDSIDSRFEQLTSDLNSKSQVLEDLIAQSGSDSEVQALSIEVEALKANLSSLDNLRKDGLKDVSQSIESLSQGFTSSLKTISQKIETRLSVLEKPTKDELTSVKKELREEIEELRRITLEGLSHIGGSPNQRIRVGGTVMSDRYADINLVAGTGISLSAADDTTDKDVDITITATGDQSVTLLDVSANSLTTPNSIYNLSAGIPVNFKSSDGNTILYLDETNERIGVGNASPSAKFDITGSLAVSTTATITTSLATPLVIGGTATTSDLTLQTTSGVGASGADMHFLVGNNGATEAMTILNSGNVGMRNTNPAYDLTIGTGLLKSQIALDGSSSGGSALFLQFLGATKAAFQFANPDTYLDYSGTWHIRTGAGSGAEVMTILTGGNVGIGTTGPTSLLTLASTGALGWDSGAGATDVSLFREAANILALRNGTNQQAFNLYHTYTDASNYERLRIAAVSNIFYIITSAAGTGTVRDLALGTADSARWVIAAATGHFLAGSDNAYDIGASVATRPRDLHIGRKIVAAGSANNRAVNNPVLYGATTDAATAVELTTNGSAGSGATNRIAVPTDTALSVVLNICVKQSASASAKQMLRQVVISNNGGTTAIQGTVVTLGTDSGTAGLATVSCTITANDTDDCLKVEVNGVIATNLRYTCYVVSCETLYA